MDRRRDGGRGRSPVRRVERPELRAVRTAPQLSPYFAGNGQGIDAQFGPSSMHPSGAMHLVGDGSVRMVADNIDPAVYDALVTRAGSEVASLAAF